MRTLSILILTAPGFLVGNAIVRGLILLPAPWPSSKVAIHEEHADDDDVVSLDFSVTHLGLLPKLYEEELAKRG